MKGKVALNLLRVNKIIMQYVIYKLTVRCPVARGPDRVTFTA